MIHTITELVDLYDEGKLEGNHFICYPTDLHKERNSQGYIPLSEIIALSKLRKEKDKRLMEIMWGKPHP